MFLTINDKINANSLHLLSRKPLPIPSPLLQDPERVLQRIHLPPEAYQDLYKHTYTLLMSK